MRLIFLNGWAVSVEMLGDFSGYLPEHEVIVLDHLYGLSLDEMANKINALLNEDCVIIGWSLGGMLALKLLLASHLNTQNLHALILLGVSPCFIKKANWQLGVDESAFAAIAATVEKQNANNLLRMFSRLLLAGSRTKDEDKKRLNDAFTTKALPDWESLKKGLDWLRDLDLRSSMPNLTLPFFGFYGESDALINPELRSWMEQASPFFHGAVIPGMGHFPFGGFAPEIARHIRLCMASLPKKGVGV